MRIVVAVGGNALLLRGEKPDASAQLEHIRVVGRGLALLATDHELVIVHGNGPQVGMLAQESAADPVLSAPYPLDVLVAQTQGMIGYWFIQALRNAGVRRPVIGLLTQTVVDIDDPAFSAPTKFIGPTYTPTLAKALGRERGWQFALDGQGTRRVVASPRPRGIIEQQIVSSLVTAGAVVVCGGGGGAPVVEANGQLRGVDAVVDKDLVASLVARAVNADRLLILTDVPGVMRDFGTPAATRIAHLDIDELTRMHFAEGSMGPKIKACSQFVALTGNPAAIGPLADPVGILRGDAGTLITPVETPAPPPPGTGRRVAAALG